jgi:hypothetical protein
MSFFNSVPMRRKHTLSECVTENGDPLAVRKKACEAEKRGSSASASQAVPAPHVNKTGQVPSTTKKGAQVRLSSENMLSPSYSQF